MSPTFLLRARWQMWCSTSTSVIVSSGQPAAAMQRTAQRENAFQATINPNSSSDSSTLFADIRGFTPLTESLPTALMMALLNEYFERMVAVWKEWLTSKKFPSRFGVR